MIPADKVREVAERSSIVDVIGDYVSLKRSGANYLGLCPFHGEKTPSFTVNPAREIFHCFGCGAGGDVFSFVMKIDGLSFREAIMKLAQRAGITIEERALTPAEQRQRSERDQLKAIMLTAAQHYRDCLNRDPDAASARKYLQEREVTPEIAARYGIGFAGNRRDALVRALTNKSLPLELATQVGVIRKGDNGYYDLLRNRLIFPIRDSNGQPIAFAGRVLDNSLPKYINSPESAIYRKSSVLFGVDLALRAIRQTGTAIIVEGYFDHLALSQAGIHHALATCGTALTDGHLMMLKKHTERICLLFDGDNAGRSATVKAMERCMTHGLPVYVISLPQPEDPDSYLRKYGSEQFLEEVQRAKPAFQQFLLWLIAKTPADSVDRRIRLLDEIMPRYSIIADSMERDLYRKEVCRLLGIDEQAFTKRLREHQGKARGTAAKTPLPVPPVIAPTMHDPTQEMLLGVMLTYPQSLSRIREIGLESLFEGTYRTLAELMATFSDEHPHPPMWQELFTSMEQPEIRELAARLLVDQGHLADMDWHVAFEQCLRRIEQRHLKELKQIATTLASLTPGTDQYQNLLARAEAIRSKKSSR